MQSKRMIIGILGLPVNEAGEFLVTRRVDHRQELNGKWQIAGGGMEFGENPEETMNREMREELGCEVEILVPYPITHTQTWDFNDHGVHVYLTVYIVKLKTSEIKLNVEASEYAWVTLDTLDVNSSLPATLPIIKKAELVKKMFLDTSFVFSPS